MTTVDDLPHHGDEPLA